MEFMFDCANPETIRHYSEIFPITGVTCNPTIVKAEGKIDFFSHFRKIRELIGFERTLHIQVIARDCAGMLAEADAIHQRIDDQVVIKVPVTEEGLKAIRALKARDSLVTATAIYSKIQGFTAIAAGADFIAPYCNRMENLDIDFRDTVAAFRQMIDENGAPTKILAASFKNIAQVNDAFLAGAQTATLQPALLHEAFGMAAIDKAIDGFTADWTSTFGVGSILDL